MRSRSWLVALVLVGCGASAEAQPSGYPERDGDGALDLIAIEGHCQPGGPRCALVYRKTERGWIVASTITPR